MISLMVQHNAPMLEQYLKSKNLLVAFDLDGTLLRCNSSFAFAKFLLSKKELTLLQFVYLTGCYLHHKLFFTSYLDLNRQVFKRLFYGWEVTRFSNLIPEFVEKFLASMIYPPTFSFLKKAQKANARVMILSHSPSFLVSEVARYLNVSCAYGTSYTIDKDQRLWDIAEVVDGKKKAEILDTERVLIKAEKVIALSDGFFDLPFLKAADVPIAVNPDCKLKKIARKNRWIVL